MKVKINIELFDQTSESQCKELGVAPKFIKYLYEKTFKEIIEEMTEDKDVEYTLNIEVEDNTIKQ